jgi:nicotinate-nucleotide adenylyltransferase
MAERRIAAYGGTFDPIHNGHIEIARAVVRNFDVEQLLLIPAWRPPHKGSKAIAGAYHRFAMAALSTLDEPRVVVSTIELEAPDRPYTFETLERLRSQFGAETKLFFVMGADSFEEINTWREPSRLISSTNLIVITRPGHAIGTSHLDDAFRSKFIDLRKSESDSSDIVETEGQHIYITGYVNNEVSSTEIRERARNGKSIEELVPSSVAEYIRNYNLYRQ